MMDVHAFASGSAGNCYLVTSGRSSILLDCGLPYREMQRRIGFALPDAVLVTHEHKDHAKAVPDLLRRGVDCYMTAGTARQLGASGHRIHIVEPRQQFRAAGFLVSAFETQHDAVEPAGYIVEDGDDKLLYATDTFYIRYRFSGLTRILIECNHSYAILDRNVEDGILDKHLRDRLVKSHFSLENLKEFLKANDLSKVTEIWLIHLSDTNSNEVFFKREIAALTGIPVYVAGGGDEKNGGEKHNQN